jgi:hypothetical protein
MLYPSTLVMVTLVKTLFGICHLSLLQGLDQFRISMDDTRIDVNMGRPLCGSFSVGGLFSQIVGDFAAVLRQFLHNLLVQPDIHGG